MKNEIVPYQKQLVIRLKRQRDLLDQLISQIGKTHELEGMSQAYDITTKQIEKNLQELRRFSTQRNRRM